MSIAERLPFLKGGASHPVLVCALGVLSLTLMDGLIKDLAGRYGTVQLTFIRFLTTAAMGGILALAVGTPLPGKAAIRGNLLRACFITASAFSFFFALGRLPIIEVFAISYIGPVLIALVAIPVLGERPSSRVYLALALGFVGVTITIGPLGAGPLDAERIAGIVAVLISAASYAGAVVLLRRQALRDPMMTVVFLQSALPATILLVPALLVPWTPIAAGDLARFVLVGALGLAGHVALVYAFARGEASRLAPVEYTSFVWAALIGLFVFAEVPGLTTVIGAAMVVAACFVVRR